MTIDIIKFNNITPEECLNYEAQYDLESTITYITSRVIMEMRKRFTDLTSDEAKQYFLTQCLLRLCINRRWLKLSKERGLTQDNYLYLSLKRAYIFYIYK